MVRVEGRRDWERGEWSGKEESGEEKRRVERQRGEWRGKEESGEGKSSGRRRGRIKEVSREKEGDVGRWER